MSDRTRHSLFVALGALFLLSCGDGGSTGLDTVALELVKTQGDDQAAQVGEALKDKLQVRVQTLGKGAASPGVEVWWELMEGPGGSLDSAHTTTDSLGLAEAGFTLGPVLGTYRIQARVKGMEAPPQTFVARAVQLPTLLSVPSGVVGAGDTILIRGKNFSPVPEQNVVIFSHVRGRVVSSSSDSVLAVVPPCLIPRRYDVRVGIGGLISTSLGLEVGVGHLALPLARGEDRVVDASEGFGCLNLPQEAGALYLVVPHSTMAVGEVEHPITLVALTSDGRSPELSARPGVPVGVDEVSNLPGASQDQELLAFLGVQTQWDEKIRGLEKDHLASRGPIPSQIPHAAPVQKADSTPPELGHKRRFTVLNANEKFTKVNASLSFVSSRALVYVDGEVPAGGFTDSDLAAFALEFDDPIHPTINGAFGEESDLDGNGRVIILFTPAVNRLTEEAAGGFVAGFFYGLDLLEGREGSNGGEVFYAMVPDPTGRFGPVVSRFAAETVLPSVLAHEFEHMVHFNRRMRLAGAESGEALWLSEALAQMAEDLVGGVFERAHHTAKAKQYRRGNLLRAKQFLSNPSRVSVLSSIPPGTLAERGAAWLLLKQVMGRGGGEELLSALVSSHSTGVENITAASGLGWRDILAGWTGALFLDGTDLPVRSELQMQGIDLRAELSALDGEYPLEPQIIGEESTLFSGTLWSSAPNYFIIRPPEGGIVISAGGAVGRPPEPGLGLQVLVVRLQ